MAAIVIRLPGPPEGKRAHRSRIAGRGPRQFVQTYPDARNVSYEGMLRQAARDAMQGRPPIEGAVTLTVHALMPVPASWSSKKRALALAGFLRPVVKPDWDNFGKTCDALKEVVWRDDRQVVEARVVKVYAEVPELRIEVEELSRVAAVASAAVREPCAPGAATELSTDYWPDSLIYLDQAAREIATPTLFDLLELRQAAA